MRRLGKTLATLVACASTVAGAGNFDAISSYVNAKTLPFYPTSFPRDEHGKNPAMAEARAFFLYPDGTPGLLIAEHSYRVRTHTVEQAGPGRISFHRWFEDRWVPAAVQVNVIAPPCVHARKVVVADFNRDGLPDFALMCHGYDASPFPGEKMKILLSRSASTYDLKVLHEDVDFFHGGAAQDFNGDGLPDILAGTISSPRLYINEGNGIFRRDKTFSQIKRAFSIELVDVTGDGKFDIVFGAHEWETPTGVLINQGNNNFGLFGNLVIPPVADAGNILDFVVDRRDGCLCVVRSGGNRTDRSIWYRGVFVQKYCTRDGTSRLIYQNKDWVDPTRDYPFTSVRWMVEHQGQIKVDWGDYLRIPLD